MTHIILLDENNRPVQSYLKDDGMPYIVVVSPLGSLYVRRYKPVRVRF